VYVQVSNTNIRVFRAVGPSAIFKQIYSTKR
jgi:hypothetical protein